MRISRNAAQLQVETIVILDFGAQYAQLIARRVREQNVYCEILPYNLSAAEIKLREPKGIILSGGPSSVREPGAPRADRNLFQLGIPVLGICYGMQLMALELGGEVQPATQREYGHASLAILDSSPLFQGLENEIDCWMSHGDTISKVPPGFKVLARTANTPIAAMGNEALKLYAVQFHPEVAHTPKGKQIIRNFLYRICGCAGEWKPELFVKESINQIREKVGSGKAICALSGGIDSTVAAVLVHKAIGENLTCIFVDHGLLRNNEAQEVLDSFRSISMNVRHVNCADRFLEKLKGVTDPEEKRKRIGQEFIRVFEAEAQKLGPIQFLVQGTLYPDVIESGSSTASTIKSHHNVGGLPPSMQLELIEPLRELFKDEVRAVAKELNVPDEIIWRHPFPGPGLAIRIVGEVTQENLKILREADAIVTEEVKKAELYRSVWQCFPVLLAVRSVGVMGDSRTYAYPIVLRAVTSEDGMTADWARLPHDLLARISTRIVNEVPHVNRVLYDITSKPPATIEWE